MDDRLIGLLLIIIGIITATSFGGTMSTPIEAIFYIGGILIALLGLRPFIKHWRNR